MYGEISSMSLFHFQKSVTKGMRAITWILYSKDSKYIVHTLNDVGTAN